MASPHLSSSPPGGERPPLFPLSDDELISSVASAIALHVASEPCECVPDALRPFDERGFDTGVSEAVDERCPTFDGSAASIQCLLEQIVEKGLDARVRCSPPAPTPRARARACEWPRATAAAHAAHARARTPRPRQATVLALVLIEHILERAAGCPCAPPCALPPTTAKAAILTTVVLASKFNYDIGVRIPALRSDAGIKSILGPGLVRLFGQIEEHVLNLLDWHLVVNAEEYTRAYAKCVELAAAAGLAGDLVAITPLRVTSYHVTSPTALSPTEERSPRGGALLSVPTEMRSPASTSCLADYAEAHDAQLQTLKELPLASRLHSSWGDSRPRRASGLGPGGAHASAAPMDCEDSLTPATSANIDVPPGGGGAHTTTPPSASARSRLGFPPAPPASGGYQHPHARREELAVRMSVIRG